jgi:hypothetical protein
MKMKGSFVFICLILLASLGLPFSASAEETGFTVARLVTAEDIADREPVNVTDTFPATTERVYCFLEARLIKEDTEVSLVWYYEDQEAALVTLLLGTSNRWRTWSSKQIAGRTGKWKVVLKDSLGNELKTIEFTVE